MRKDFKQHHKPEQSGAKTLMTPECAERERTRALAYELWHVRGCPDGSAEVDWYRAEALLKEMAEEVPALAA